MPFPCLQHRRVSFVLASGSTKVAAGGGVGERMTGSGVGAVVGDLEESFLVRVSGAAGGGAAVRRRGREGKDKRTSAPAGVFVLLLPLHTLASLGP